MATELTDFECPRKVLTKPSSLELYRNKKKTINTTNIVSNACGHNRRGKTTYNHPNPYLAVGAPSPPFVSPTPSSPAMIASMGSPTFKGGLGAVSTISVSSLCCCMPPRKPTLGDLLHESTAPPPTPKALSESRRRDSDTGLPIMATLPLRELEMQQSN
jgi:hypothetical protein